jgi:hypothetical protein
MSSKLCIYRVPLYSEPTRFERFKRKAETKFALLKCHKYADSRYVAAAAIIMAIALAAFSPIGSALALGIGFVALGKTIYKNQEAIKDFINFGLFKKSTPEDEVQDILSEAFESKESEGHRPIFIDGKNEITFGWDSGDEDEIEMFF